MFEHQSACYYIAAASAMSDLQHHHRRHTYIAQAFAHRCSRNTCISILEIHTLDGEFKNCKKMSPGLPEFPMCKLKCFPVTSIPSLSLSPNVRHVAPTEFKAALSCCRQVDNNTDLTAMTQNRLCHVSLYCFVAFPVLDMCTRVANIAILFH